MNKLIEIITAYLDGKKISERRWDGTVGDFSAKWPCAKSEIAEELSDQLTSSGFRQLNFETIQQAIIDTPDEHKFSDGYHTFESLYDIRLAYNVALFNEWADQLETIPGVFDQHSMNLLCSKHDVHKSQRHHDGEPCFGGGWFIVVANLPSGQISNHYEMKHWDLFKIPSYEKAKYEWDGHTSEDVINRLKSL